WYVRPLRHLSFCSWRRRPPGSTLFPCTTLFRSVVGIFIPGTAILLSVGGLIGAGLLDPVATALWAFSGAVAANWVSYRLGRKIRSEEHTSELQSREKLVCRLLLEKKKPRIC